MSVANTKIISLCVEASDFEKVIAAVDAQAAREKSSRSNVLRNILYDHFGIVPETPFVRINRAKSRAKQA